MQISQINDVNVQTNYTSKLNKFVPCMNNLLSKFNVLSSCYFSFNRVLSMNIKSCSMWIIHVPFVQVMKRSDSREMCIDRMVYILEGTYVPVTCVINHLRNSGVWRNISTYILESILIYVMFMINHSGTRIFWRYINTFILESFLIFVISVISHLGNRVT